MRLLLILLAALFSTANAASYERFVASWETTCSIDNTNFKLKSKSKSNSDDGNDHQIFIGDNPAPINVKEALYLRSSVVSKAKSVCKDIPVFNLGNGYLLILLRSDNRPGLDNLSAVLYSTDGNMVTSKIENMGALKLFGSQGIAVKSTDNGFQIRLVREWLQDTGADSIEIAIEDWMNLQIEGNKLSASWN